MLNIELDLSQICRISPHTALTYKCSWTCNEQDLSVTTQHPGPCECLLVKDIIILLLTSTGKFASWNTQQQKFWYPMQDRVLCKEAKFQVSLWLVNLNLSNSDLDLTHPKSSRKQGSTQWRSWPWPDRPKIVFQAMII